MQTLYVCQWAAECNVHTASESVDSRCMMMHVALLDGIDCDGPRNQQDTCETVRLQAGQRNQLIKCTFSTWLSACSWGCSGLKTAL